jgi:hypothetical protein
MIIRLSNWETQTPNVAPPTEMVYYMHFGKGFRFGWSLVCLRS